MQIVALTTVDLSFQSTDESVNVLYHPPDLEGPILFSYREKVFFGKKRAALRVENGEWSEKFALDAAGSTGLVECQADGVKYDVSQLTIVSMKNEKPIGSTITLTIRLVCNYN